jgi:uncharacterized protein
MIINREHKQVIVFSIAVIGLSFFVFWGPIALLNLRAANLVEGRINNIPAFILFLAGGFVPSVTGIALTRVYEGTRGLKDMFRSAINVKISTNLYLIIFLYPVIIGTFQVIIYRLTGGSINFSQFIKQLPTVLPLLILGPISEEFGWRGFMQKRIKNISSPIAGSIIIGLVWSTWHLPLFYMSGTSQHDFNIPFIPFMVSVISSSFVYTYVYLKSTGSLFAVILLHWTGTYILQVIASQVSRTPLYNWLECLPSLVLGLYFMIFLMKLK